MASSLLKMQFIVCFILVLSAGVIFLAMKIITSLLDYLQTEGDEKLENSWILRLILNLIGYATIYAPIFLIKYYLEKSKFLENADDNCFSFILRKIYMGLERAGYTNMTKTTRVDSFLRDAVVLVFCAAGLLGSYLTWGILQEGIMTQKYTNSHGMEGKFRDSQFLVFVNRVLAFVLSGICLMILRQPAHTVPLYKYMYCSFSNIMSSWCQYEALKFISFPTQVLAKACKIIPVMLMGKIVLKKKYKNYEYSTAVLICVGMALFLVGSSDATKNKTTVTTFSGIILIVGYMAFDSFTSNWQSAMFTRYSATSLQMMCGVNFFSCLFTAVSLIQQDSFSSSSYFMIQFPAFAWDCLLLSICSALGQLFIFYTVLEFGPVVFVIIMTIRQAFAIILSCILYGHALGIIGVFGISVVFLAIFWKTYYSQRLKRKKEDVSSV